MWQDRMTYLALTNIATLFGVEPGSPTNLAGTELRATDAIAADQAITSML
jgi:hypothetical protein